MRLGEILERIKQRIGGGPVPVSDPIAIARAAGAIPQGPIPGSKLTADFVREIGRFAYLWGWPLVNVYNRYWTQSWVKTQTFLVGGVAPIGPINRLAMLTGYNEPGQRYITCPSQDLIYGFGVLDLSADAVVVQVPDFGERFFVFQVTDHRTDAFSAMGSMYGTKEGFYLLAGPGWKGRAPAGIDAIFRASTNLGCIIPRVFQTDDPADNAAVQPLLRKIMAYPLSEFHGATKEKDWNDIIPLPWATLDNEEWRWVKPENFFDTLPRVLDLCPPLPGEEALYALFRSILETAREDSAVREALREAAAEADTTLVAPLLEFHNFGVSLPHHWTTVLNSAEFGTDYYTRTAVAKSNIFINRPRETRYFYQDFDRDGVRLDGSKRYTVTFRELPPVKGFWSITLYDRFHFLAPNALNRFSLGTKSRNLRSEADGSLTIYVQKDRPEADEVPNWLPSPDGPFSLFIRAYWPLPPIAEGRWTPPAVVPA
ncbi:MAG TPA: DUF1254 domain-containing protein [Methyloceanibacter sp.]|nr:DUF1254 domain-containing protein [Methyloceanibacter sp.]